MADYLLQRLRFEHMDAAARVHREASWLKDLHTPAEYRAYFEGVLFPRNAIWGALGDDGLVGIIAFRKDWVDQLQVLPEYQSHGIGTALLDVAKSMQPYLQLWTFQRNARARHFYERRGFNSVEQTDGMRNEENEPDVRYEWHAGET